MKVSMKVQDVLKRKVMKSGNSAHCIVPKKYIGETAYILIKGKKKLEHPIVLKIDRDDLRRIWKVDPRITEIDWNDFKRREKEWTEIPDDGYFNKE